MDDTIAARSKQAIAVYEKHKNDQLLGDPTNMMEPSIYPTMVSAITSNIVLGLANEDSTATKSSIRDLVYKVVGSGPFATSQLSLSLICEQILRETPVASLLELLKD